MKILDVSTVSDSASSFPFIVLFVIGSQFCFFTVQKCRKCCLSACCNDGMISMYKTSVIKQCKEYPSCLETVEHHHTFVGFTSFHFIGSAAPLSLYSLMIQRFPRCNSMGSQNRPHRRVNDPRWGLGLV